MKSAIFGCLAVALLAGSSGCCCLEQFGCWGCRGGCAYGNEGPCDSCGYGGYGGYGGYSSGGGGGKGCASCGMAGGPSSGRGPSAQAMASRGGRPPRGAVAYSRPRPANGGHPAQGHPYVKQRRDSGDDYEFAAGPPTGATTYPYYTNRGPRDFLARNPRDIGP